MRKTDFRLVKLDDSQNWNIEEADKVYGKIFCIYLYDTSIITHCCELQGSYEMIPLYYETEKEITDALYDVIQENGTTGYENGCYMHCAHIDSMKNSIPVFKSQNDRYAKPFGKKYMEILNSTIEHYTCNHEMIADPS